MCFRALPQVKTCLAGLTNCDAEMLQNITTGIDMATQMCETVGK